MADLARQGRGRPEAPDVPSPRPALRRWPAALAIFTTLVALACLLAALAGQLPPARLSAEIGKTTPEQKQCEEMVGDNNQGYVKACAGAFKACMGKCAQGSDGGPCRNACKSTRDTCRKAAAAKMRQDLSSCSYLGENACIGAVDECGLGVPSAYANPFCVGKVGRGGANPHKDGNSYVCKAAVGKAGCTTSEELASIFCACCYCYNQCGLKDTESAVCKYNGTCSSPTLCGTGDCSCIAGCAA